MRVQDIMTSDVETIGPDVLLDAAAERMRVAGIHHLVVVEGRAITGVVAAGDLAALGERPGPAHTVREAMSPNPARVEPRTTVRRASNLLRTRSVGCLPVVERGKLVGIVTISDLLEVIGRGTQVERKGRVDHFPRRRVSTDLRRLHPGPALGQLSGLSARAARAVRKLSAPSARRSTPPKTQV